MFHSHTLLQNLQYCVSYRRLSTVNRFKNSRLKIISKLRNVAYTPIQPEFLAFKNRNFSIGIRDFNDSLPISTHYYPVDVAKHRKDTWKWNRIKQFFSTDKKQAKIKTTQRLKRRSIIDEKRGCK